MCQHIAQLVGHNGFFERSDVIPCANVHDLRDEQVRAPGNIAWRLPPEVGLPSSAMSCAFRVIIMRNQWLVIIKRCVAQA